MAVAGSRAALADWAPADRFPDKAVEVLDPSFERYRLALSAVERIATGLRWAEGPTWFGDTRQLIFSDVSNNRMMRWDEETGQLYTFRKPSNFSNGNTRDRQGRLVTCEHMTQRVTRTEHDGTITVMADRGPEGKPFNSPNDIVCKSDGSIWFTDPAFGPNMLEAMQPPTTPGRVYRIDPETKKVTIIDGDIRGPNGLCFSPDESKLYVIEARATPNRLIVVYDVAPNGTSATNRRVFYDCGNGAADGFRADVDGNLWCGWGMGEAEDGVIVLSPQAKMIGRIRLPERCPNLVFGGEKRNRLLMCASKSIYALYVNTQGAVVGA
ncbi:MAG: SMP-30/gluconolactonase/LRE family protein [Acetobacteraceae bacterium]|nr:SMP-30/gluconolactonase/LRE family protein [Acetobacteraceae bacterium]